MDVFEQLLTSGSSKGVSPETLEYIGQKASAEFLDKKTPLNESIVKLASQHPELNNEHIHRIVEFANNSTFQHLFEKNKEERPLPDCRSGSGDSGSPGWRISGSQRQGLAQQGRLPSGADPGREGRLNGDGWVGSW